MARPDLYGVSTTRIFCRFGCPSRQPRPHNVVYFASTQEAISEGFRPCKRCRPDQEKAPRAAFADFICRQLLELAHANPNGRIADYAAALWISTRQLERIVRDTTGSSPRLFLHSARGERP